MDPTTDPLAWLYEILSYPLFKLGDRPLTLIAVLQFTLLTVLLVLVERLLRRSLLQRILNRTRLDEGLRFAIARITGYFFLAIGFYVALTIVGIDLTSLAVIAGAIGVGIGFGLQSIVNNVLSGLILLAERPIAIGHRVEVNGIEGQVKKINLRSTVVTTNNNISVIVPNSYFISEPVVNWSYGDPKVRLTLPVGIAYGSDVERFRQLMTDLALANPHVLREPAPTVFFLGFGDSSLNFEIAVWTVAMARNPKRFRSDLFFAIERTLREAAIEIPFPQRDLNLRSGTLPIRRAPRDGPDASP